MLHSTVRSWKASIAAAATLTLFACNASAPSAQSNKPEVPPSSAGKAGDEKPKAAAQEFSVDGNYVEACSCSPPCPCELVGPNMSCEGVGAYHFDKGTFGSDDFSGTSFAYSLYIGKEVRMYFDAPDAKKRAAVEKFARAALAAFGPVKSVRDAKVEIVGKDGSYTVSVDGGKTMSFVTEPVLGGDKKTPIVHLNTQDAVNPTMYQASCLSCTYADGEMKITLDKGRNSYFNQHMKTSGKL